MLALLLFCSVNTLLATRDTKQGHACNHGAPLSIIFQLQLQLLQLVVERFLVRQPPASVAQPLAFATTARAQPFAAAPRRPQTFASAPPESFAAAAPPSQQLAAAAPAAEPLPAATPRRPRPTAAPRRPRPTAAPRRPRKVAAALRRAAAAPAATAAPAGAAVNTSRHRRSHPALRRLRAD